MFVSSNYLLIYDFILKFKMLKIRFGRMLPWLTRLFLKHPDASRLDVGKIWEANSRLIAAAGTNGAQELLQANRTFSPHNPRRNSGSKSLG